MRSVVFGAVPQLPCKIFTRALAAGLAVFTTGPQFLVMWVVRVAYIVSTGFNTIGFSAKSWQIAPKHDFKMMA